jgi:hypothetical protein
MRHLQDDVPILNCTEFHPLQPLLDYSVVKILQKSTEDVSTDQSPAPGQKRAFAPNLQQTLALLQAIAQEEFQ